MDIKGSQKNTKEENPVKENRGRKNKEKAIMMKKFGTGGV